jgi:hypothetical protein
MGRPKAGQAPAGKLEMVISMKGVRAWREWLEDVANRAGLGSSSAVVDEALAEWAAKRDYPPTPDRKRAKS